MLPTWLFLVCVAAAWWGLRAGRLTVVYLVSCVFGASAAMTVLAYGDAPVTPALFFAPLLVWQAWRQAGLRPWLGGLSLREAGGWFAVYTGWAVLGAIFLPRVFAGALSVYTTSRGGDAGLGVQLSLLAPNSTNITQSAYLGVGLLVLLSLRVLAGSPDALRWLRRALYVAAALNAFFALIDAISAFAGTELGLSLIRNAKFAIVAQSAGGLPRLQGAFSEPSALAAFTTALFGCLFGLWIKGVDRAWSGTLATVSAAVLMLTLSTTAFVGFALLAVITLLVHVAGSVTLPSRLRYGWRMAVLLALVVVACVLTLWMPPWLEHFGRIVHAMVVDKSESASAIERMTWIVACWDNFVDTYGFGVGAGSARGSSWPLVVLGNVGWFGALTMLVALSLVFAGRLRHLPDETRHLVFALRIGLLGVLIPATLSGTMIDPGPMFHALAGLVIGLSRPHGRSVEAEEPAPADTRWPGPADGADWAPTVVNTRV